MLYHGPPPASSLAARRWRTHPRRPRREQRDAGSEGGWSHWEFATIFWLFCMGLINVNHADLCWFSTSLVSFAAVFGDAEVNSWYHLVLVARSAVKRGTGYPERLLSIAASQAPVEIWRRIDMHLPFNQLVYGGKKKHYYLKWNRRHSRRYRTLEMFPSGNQLISWLENGQQPSS